MSRARTSRIEYRWADRQMDRLPMLAEEASVRRPVAVLAAAGARSSVCRQDGDHDHSHRVHRRRRPGQARTCRRASPARRQHDRVINFVSAELAAKWLELMRELLPAATRVAVLVNPTNASRASPLERTQKRRPAPWGCRSGSSAPEQPRDRCGLRRLRARTARRAAGRRRPRFSPAVRVASSANLAAHRSSPGDLWDA